MSLKIKQNGKVKDLIIPACGVQILDMEDKFKSDNLEEVLQELGEGESVYISNKEPDKDGIWIDTSDTTSDENGANENPIVKEIKEYMNHKIGDLSGLSTGAKDNLVNAINENTTQLSEMENRIGEINITNRPVISKILTMTDSLGASGNFKGQLAERFNVTAGIENVKGGQQISMGLCALSEKIYCKQVDENLLKWSNDLSKWSKTSGIVVEQEKLGDGLIWNKITKTDDSANRTVFQEGDLSDPNITLKYPTDGCGAVMGFDLYLPKGCNCKKVGIYIENITTGKGQQYFVTGSDLNDDTKIRVILYYSDKEITWTKNAKERIKFTIHLNKNANDLACHAYIRNCYLSFHPISGYQSYISTTDKGIVGDLSKATYKEIERNPFPLQDLDMITLQYGRNDSGDGVSHTSFFKAYDKLVYESKRWSSVVVPLNPPPLKGTGDIWQPTDSYFDNHYLETFKKYMFRWNIGINIFEKFKKLISDGTYTQTQLYGDNIHTNQLGASVIIDYIENDINKKINMINNFVPKLNNKIRYYLHGEPNGDWTTEYISQFDVEQKVIIGDFRGSLAKVNSTQNDYLEFTNIDCEQLHIIFRENKTYGSFKVVIDEGTGNEITKTYVCNLYDDRQAGKFLVDFGISDTHNVKIYNLENKKIVIYGLVAI